MATTIKTLSKLQGSYEFIVELLKNPKNRCIKKTNMRSETSKVHTGGDNWELQPDSGIYKKFVTEGSLNMGEFLGKNGKKMRIQANMLKELIRYSDLMSDCGYSSNDAEHAELKKEFKQLLQDVRIYIYNQTKQDSKKKTGGKVPAKAQQDLPAIDA